MASAISLRPDTAPAYPSAYTARVRTDELFPPPPAVRTPLESLERAGHDAYLIGRCVREQVQGTTPADYEVATSAPLAARLSLFRRGVVTGPDLLCVPTAAGAIDLHPFRFGSRLEDELSHRDFTIHAMALRADGRLLDPHGGRADLAAGVLRAPGDPDARFAEDPLRVLRAARLVAELGFALAPDSEVAAARHAARVATLRPARVRAELAALLLAPGVEQGLVLLRRLGLEAALAPGVADDAARIVARLPRDLELRLAAWLPRAGAVAALRALRVPRARTWRVERLLQLHPIDSGPAHARESRIRRLARRSEQDLLGLIALREAEIAVRAESESAAHRLAGVKEALARVQRAEHLAAERATLALSGEDVMRHLGVGSGAHVGRALRHLAHRVAEDPSCNQRESLLALLDTWATAQEIAAPRREDLRS